MKKILLSLLLLAFAAGASAQTFKPEGRVDVDGAKDGVGLTPGECSANGKCRNMTWGDPAKRKLHIFAIFPAGPEWAQGSFSFVPEKDGNLLLDLRGCYTNGEPPVGDQWVYMDDIRLEGAKLANGGFEDGAQDWDCWGKDGLKAEVANMPHSGEKSMRVAHDAPAKQCIAVKAGQPVKVSFWFKKAQ